MDEFQLSLKTFYFVLGSVALVMAFYAGVKGRARRERRMKDSPRARYLQQLSAKSHESILASLNETSLALMKGELEISEGSKRISKLLQYVPNFERKSEYQIFDEYQTFAEDDQARVLVASQILYEHTAALKSL